MFLYTLHYVKSVLMVYVESGMYKQYLAHKPYAPPSSPSSENLKYHNEMCFHSPNHYPSYQGSTVTLGQS